MEREQECEDEIQDYLSADSDSTLSRLNSFGYDEYDPIDFPRLNEIEEFGSPFFWSESPLPTARGESSSSFSETAQILYDKRLQKELAAKLQKTMVHLNILLCLTEAAACVPPCPNSACVKVNLEARRTLVEARGLDNLDKVEDMIDQLEAAIAKISDLLPVKALLAKPILLAEVVAKTAGQVQTSHRRHRQCQDLRSAAKQLDKLLWMAARKYLYEQATRRIIDSAEQALYMAAKLVQNCRTYGNIVSIVFNTSSAKSFRKVLHKLNNSIGDISWLLHICRGWWDDEVVDCYLGPPPIAVKENLLCQIWEQVAKLHDYSSEEDKAEAAVALASLARHRDRYGKLIIKAGAVAPLLKLIKKNAGKIEGQISSMETLAALCDEPEVAEMVAQDHQVCYVLIKFLKQGHIYGLLARAVSQLAAHNRQCEYLFTQLDVVQLLIRWCLLDDNEALGMLKAAGANTSAIQQQSLMALCSLAKGNPRTSRSIVDSRIMLHFPTLLDNSSEVVRENTALLILEIARVAQRDAELRCYAFNPSLPAGTAVVSQLLRIVKNNEYNNKLLVSCIESVGCLSKIFWKNEIVEPLVNLLNFEEQPDVVREAIVALTKFTEKKRNYLYKTNSKAVANAATVYLTRLVNREQAAHKLALLLACQVASQVPDNKDLSNLLAWASKQKALIQDAPIKTALADWKGLRG